MTLREKLSMWIHAHMPAQLNWYAHRLALMTVGEVMFRFRRAARHRADKLAMGSPLPLRHATAFTGREMRPIHWFIDLENRAAVSAFMQRQFHWTDEAASKILRHEFSFFDFHEQPLGAVLKWNHDYRYGVDTPLTFGPMLDYRDVKRCGDVKYTWELNRHHHLVELGKAYYLTGDRRFKDEVIAQLDSWFQDCPAPFGINWSSTLELGIRVINWCFCLKFLVAQEPQFVENNTQFMRRWIASIHEHLKFIRHHISFFSSANNHLIGELSGLFIGAVCFDFEESEEWSSLAHRILEEEASAQIWPDGVDKEQAISYQAFVFDFLLLVGIIGRKNGMEFGGEFWGRLEKMAEFIHALISPDGNVPRIGDEDDAHVVQLALDREFNKFRSLLASAACIFGRRDFKESAAVFDEKTFWLHGFDGWSNFQEGQIVGPPRLAFESGGYYILSSDSSRLIFDCGPIGYLSLAAHGHADALSVLLDYRGKEFLVDVGTYAYHTKPEWRQYFRGTTAHNTVCVDGEHQSVMGGNFMWRTKANATVLRRSATNVGGRHDGYRRLASPVDHEREVRYVADENKYQIIDRLDCKATHRIQQFFHLSPESACVQQDDGFIITNGRAAIRLVPDRRVMVKSVLRGSLAPLSGWYSAGYDRKIATATICFEITTQSDVELTTEIFLT